MNYTVIDQTTWPRREFFEHFMSTVPCTYSMTAPLDITTLRQKRLKLYPTMLYLLTKTVNQHEQFRMALRENDELVCYDSMEPCYTVFHKERETFSNLWTAYQEDYGAFCRDYAENLRRYGNTEGFLAKPNPPENRFTVSMLPWTTFDGFHLSTPIFRYLPPIFTLGKYREENGRVLLPLAVQVHHAVCDGFHVCRFVNDLQAALNDL